MTHIELKDIQDFIVKLRDRGYKLMEVTYDKFQSLDSIQQLQNMNIKVFWKYQIFIEALHSQKKMKQKTNQKA